MVNMTEKPRTRCRHCNGSWAYPSGKVFQENPNRDILQGVEHRRDFEWKCETCNKTFKDVSLGIKDTVNVS